MNDASHDPRDYRVQPVLIDGQIYHWRWREPPKDDRFTYWCKSRIAVVRDGKLLDTFWSDNSPERVIDPKKVELTFFADESWDTISEWEAVYYDPEDVASTRHSNNSRAPIYLRPGAVRNAAAILTEVMWKEEEAERQIRSGKEQLKRLADVRKLVAEGRLNEVHL